MSGMLAALLLLASVSPINALLSYSSLPKCAQKCAAEYASEIQCYLPNTTLCFCTNLTAKNSAQLCGKKACQKSEPQWVVDDVDLWYAKVCDDTSGPVSDLVPNSNRKPTTVYESVTPNPTGPQPTSSNNSYSPSPSPPPGGPSTGTIVGIAAGAVIVVVAAGLTLFIFWRRKSQPSAGKDTNAFINLNNISPQSYSAADETSKQWGVPEMDGTSIMAPPIQKSSSQSVYGDSSQSKHEAIELP